MRGTPVVVPLFLLLIAPIAACSEERPDRAITVEDGDGADQRDAEPNGDPAEAEEPESAAGKQLTQQQAEAALLSVNELPSGWAGTPPEEEDESEDTIEPERCQVVIDSLDKLGEETAVAEADAEFNKGGAFGVQLSESISSYSDEVDPGWLESTADAFTECPQFTSTDSQGVISHVTVSPLSFANLGDQTVAFAMTYEQDDWTISVNIAMVAVGHNLVSLFSGGIAGSDGAELEQFGRKAIAKLEDVAG
ncbi:MAG TPA: hypothetical protein VD859_15975 [Nocardioides sp.]|nr:hypothetical protein [Nocardioides sp.]